MAALETKGQLAALDLDDGAQPMEIPLQRDSIRMIFAP
jgi:hypothetical protein